MDFKEFFANEFEKVSFDVPLKNVTTFRIGGPCSVLVEPLNQEEIKKALAFCKNNGVKYFILGNGSNVLASDSGFDGVIVKLGVRFAQLWEEEGVLFAQSGAFTKSVFDFALKNELGGTEFMAAIPSSVGGAVVMNAGCFGSEISDIVSRVWATDGKDDRVFSHDEIGFSYRDSVFQKNGFVITKVEFDLKPSSRNYILRLADELKTAKRLSQPLEFFSAGSVFKRPECGFAASLIDRCGLKGKKIGDAQISEKHAGFIVNRGKATCGDVLQLVQIAKSKVRADFGVDLQLELKLLGDTDDIRRLSYSYGVQPR